MFEKSKKTWNFHIGIEESVNNLFFIFIEFQQQNQRGAQKSKIDFFCRLPVLSAQCVFGTEKYTDSGIFSNYSSDVYSQGYDWVKEGFRALTKDDIVQPYKSYEDFRKSNDGKDNGYNLYVFDIRYKKNFTNSQSIKVNFIFDDDFPIPAFVIGWMITLWC